MFNKDSPMIVQHNLYHHSSWSTWRQTNGKKWWKTGKGEIL